MLFNWKITDLMQIHVLSVDIKSVVLSLCLLSIYLNAGDKSFPYIIALMYSSFTIYLLQLYQVYWQMQFDFTCLEMYSQYLSHLLFLSTIQT